MDPSVRKSIISKIKLGDMVAIYYLVEELKQVELLLVPASMEDKIVETKFSRGTSLVQVKLLGDAYPGSYSQGLSMLNSETVEKRFKYDSQEVKENGIDTTVLTYLKDARGYMIVHCLNYKRGEAALTSWTKFINGSNKPVTLELLSSFCLTEITPFEKGEAVGALKLHRIRSRWSEEGRLVTDDIESLQLETSWVKWQPNSEKFGQLGSMPVKKYFPFIAVEDTNSDVIWAAQLAIESSWQMEAYRRDDALCICGGLADREFGHWMKRIDPDTVFTTPVALISCCQGGVDHVTQRLTSYLNQFVSKKPICEQELPILFNEYCTTWGLPSYDNIKGIVNNIKNKGIDYFVIDCGWFVEEGKNWGVSMGDYIPSPKLFPNGLESVVELIKDAEMKPGLWFEIDNVGEESRAYNMEEHLLKRDGYVLTTGNRRFWDMRDTWVQGYLREKVIDTLNNYGFEYIKMDYNDTIGIGCDGAESLGEGLRRNMECSVDFVRQINDSVPNIVIENCASGGHKLEPLMMSLCSMASFSDAHESEEIPIIAANLHRCILPRQSQIWAVIRENATLKRIAYVMSSTFLGRMCLSGDVTNLTEKQWAMIESGIAFYKRAVPVIKHGYSYIYSFKSGSDRHPRGYQVVVRVQTEPGLIEDGFNIYEGKHEKALVVIHTFEGTLPEEIVMQLPNTCPTNIECIYSDAEIDVKIEAGRLHYKVGESANMRGVGILLN